MNQIISVDQAARIMRAAMGEAINRYWMWYLGQGILIALVGMVGLFFPVLSSIALIYTLGCLLVASAVLQAASLIGTWNVPHFWLQLVAAILSLIVGLVLLSNPGSGLVAFTLLLIVYFVVGGMAKVVLALTIRPVPKWSWILTSGLIGILLGAILFGQLKAAAPWLLGFMVGIQLFCEGTALACLAWSIRKANLRKPRA